jgi:Flp pilus assembly protein TadG
VYPLRRCRRGDRGQATVEMALVLPLLIWLLVGLVDIARMANAYLIIQHASREAVRLGITGAGDTAVAQRAVLASQTLDPTRLTINVSPAGTRNTGSDISVRIQYNYQVLALMGIIGADVPLEARLTARVE